MWGGTGSGEAGVATAAQLERFCITPDLQAFVRSMTYSTYRWVLITYSNRARNLSVGHLATGMATQSAYRTCDWRLNVKVPW